LILLTIPTKPDFAKAYQSANEILVTSSVITKFPFSTKELVTELFANQAPLVCRSYQKAKKYGLEITDFGSQSALLTQYGSRYIIFYDDSKPKTHARFSILHELGHKVIGHDLSNKDKATYSKYEIETNYFAAQLLMPEQLLRELQKRQVDITPRFLQTTFGVSMEAANKRIETLAKTNAEWKSRAEKEFDDIILNRHTDFLNKIRPAYQTYDFEDDYARQCERDRWM
jgi:Zn-dependent peptidase ImmA (M78 family)